MENQNAKKIFIIPNEQYGSYIALNEIIVTNSKSIERKWEVKHVVTEKKYIMRPSYLSKLKFKYDDILKKGDYQKGLKNYLYKDTIRGASNRKHTFNLSFEDFIGIINKNCFYCGEKPKKVTNKILISRGHINEPPLRYNGIDRLNPENGYSIENCVPCCSTCNYMKHTQQISDFLEHVKKIYNHTINN